MSMIVPFSPPRARHRRSPSQTATITPSTMQSAYARIGMNPRCQTPSAGLGMEARGMSVRVADVTLLGGLGDGFAQLLRRERDAVVEDDAVDLHGRGALDLVLVADLLAVLGLRLRLGLGGHAVLEAGGGDADVLAELDQLVDLEALDGLAGLVLEERVVEGLLLRPVGDGAGGGPGPHRVGGLRVLGGGRYRVVDDLGHALGGEVLEGGAAGPLQLAA